MRARLLWNDLRSSYLFRPALWVIGLGLLAFAFGRVDQLLLDRELLPHPALIVGGATGARTMLDAIGTALLTVAALVYSVIMLAVVQTANAYSPRLLDEYLSDTHNQHVLGILIGTFLYTLLALREVRTSGDVEYVPAIMVTTGLGLSVLCVGAFVYFLHHVAHSIEVSEIVHRIQRETSAVLQSLASGVGEPCPAPQATPAEVATITVARDGYVEAIAFESLFDLACRAGVAIRLELAIGHYVIAEHAFVSIWPRERASDALLAEARDTLTVSRERTVVQDLLYGVQQLSDVALRALSPAVNDPTTALNCLDVITSLLAERARQAPVSAFRCDSSGALRLIAPEPTFAELLDVAFNQIRHYGSGDLVVLRRLLEACRQVAHVTVDETRRAALWEHVARTVYMADQRLATPWERAALEDQLARTALALGRSPAELPFQWGDGTARAESNDVGRQAP